MVKYLLIGALIVAFFTVCEKDNPAVDCSTMNNEGVELVYPKGTESFKIGDKVTVKWKVDPSMVSSVDILVSTVSSTGPFTSILKKGSIAVPNEDGAICMDTIWHVGNEDGNIEYTSSQNVYLRVEDYFDSSVRQTSGMITINE